MCSYWQRRAASCGLLMPRCWARSFAGLFLPVIEEVLDMRISPDYFQHVRRKLEQIARDR